MGMSTRIGRKVTITTCSCVIVRDRDVEHVEVELYGDYSDLTRATNAVRKKLGTQQVLVESVKHRSAYYSMPIEKFVQDADQVTERQLLNNIEEEE